jgi:hypothetical protein
VTRIPRYHYRTEYLLDGVWFAARYFTRISNARKWVKRAISNGWEARYERVKT